MKSADSWECATQVDIIARVPAALDAIVLGADEAEILMALAELSDAGELALTAVAA